MKNERTKAVRDDILVIISMEQVGIQLILVKQIVDDDKDLELTVVHNEFE